MPRLIPAAASSTVGALVLALAGSAAAAPSASAEFGQHVAAYAHESLGQRQGPPSVTCSNDGMTMNLPTFGPMAQHMREMHAG